MDHAFFDRIARLLGQAASRRAGIAAAAAAIGLGAESASAKPGKAGPCGDGGRKANACAQDGDCCTGICNMKVAKTNLDGLGRCRCRKRNAKCTEDRNCCSRAERKMVCRGGICTNPCVSLGAACTLTDTCCAGICVGLTSGSPALDAPTCCLPLGASGCTVATDCCDGATGGATCTGGVCTSTCLPLGAACTSTDICCTGTCDGATGIESRERQTRDADPVCCLPNGATGCIRDVDCCQSSGVVNCNSGTCETGLSDIRLKEQVAPIENGLDLVSALRPVRWEWTESSGLGRHPRIGFIAQEVQEVVPEVVGTYQGDYLGIDYAKLVAVLTGAVQEQQAEIADLRTRLAALESTCDGRADA